jgi:NTP pyrophosphatase (non-canonical NTP hydrolase)
MAETKMKEMADILCEIAAEVERSKVHGEKFASLHEAYAVTLEELDEVWDITRQKRKDRNAKDLRKELIQIGAMAVKAIGSMDNFIGGTI